MLIDLRYHLTSLVAVFLALAVGIIVGSSFIAGSSVKGLEEQFAKLRDDTQQQRQEIENLRVQLQKHDEFGRFAAPMIVNNQLAWRQVAIIQTGDYSEATQRAKSILEEAGAKVVSVTTLSNLDSPAARERLLRAVELTTGEANSQDPVGRVLEIVARSVVLGADNEAMDILEDKRLLSRSGEYKGKVLRIVLVGGSKFQNPRRPEHVDVVLIDKLKEAGAVRIVGTEPLEVRTSYIPAYHSKQIPTVDNVDQYMGQVALVFAVSGETGSFGVKKSADRVVPDYLESGQWRFGFRR